MFMLYEPKLNKAMLAILQNRVAGIANCINALLQEGYVPNKNKYTIFNWSAILIDAYENINVFTKEQQDKLDLLYNKILKM